MHQCQWTGQTLKKHNYGNFELFKLLYISTSVQNNWQVTKMKSNYPSWKDVQLMSKCIMHLWFSDDDFSNILLFILN
jgi:hypothetical protein